MAGLARGPVSVTELAAPFAISLPAVSKHLNVLEQAGLIRRERDGRFQRCYFASEALDSASAFIERYRPFWMDSLDQLAAYVERGEPSAVAVRVPNTKSKARRKR